MKVLVLNFFGDSPLEVSQWRLVLAMADKNVTENVGVPRFDQIRHAGLCSEVRVCPSVLKTVTHHCSAQIALCGDHESSQKPLDCGPFGKGRAYESN
jgi:hypothetical protein